MKKINKKGFTLVELLSTITIMGIIATMATINISTSYKNKNKIAENNKNEIIENAACVYLELKENKNLKMNCKQNGCSLSTTTLIKKGLLDEEDVDKEKIINIYYEKNEKKCKIKEV